MMMMVSVAIVASTVATAIATVIASAVIPSLTVASVASLYLKYG
jgi:hypothetical protein